MGMDALALEVQDSRRDRKKSKNDIEGSSVARDKRGKKKERRKGLEVAIDSEEGFSVVVDEIYDVQGFSGEREKSKKKDRRKEVEGSVDGLSGSKDEGRAIEGSNKRKGDGKKIKDFYVMDSEMGFVDVESREKKKKKKRDRSDDNDTFNDERKRREERSDKPGIAPEWDSRDDGMINDGKSALGDPIDVKKRKKRGSDSGMIEHKCCVNELRSTSSIEATANTASEIKMKTEREEKKKKKDKKKKRHISDDNQYENDSSQEKSKSFSALEESVHGTIDEKNSKKKKRKKVKQGCDDEHGEKDEGLGSESNYTENGNRKNLITEKENGDNLTLKKDGKSHLQKKKKKCMSEFGISACVVPNGIAEVSARKKAGEMEEQSAGNVSREDQRLSVNKEKSKKVSFAEVCSTGKLGGECMNSSSRSVKVTDSGNCEDNQPTSKKKTDRKEYQKDISLDVQEKLKTKDEDAKSNEMDRRVTIDERTRGSNDHPNTKVHKRVTFSSEVQVFPPSDDEGGEGKLLTGKRFSKEEDEMVKEAVLNYIEVHDLGPNGLEMVLNCKKHSQTRGCWKEIGAVIPRRTCESVYHRAHILFERSDIRKWSQEDYELIKSYHAEHGADWKTLATELGRHRHHLKDTWRRIRLPNNKKGPWSQEEYQKLFELVHLDLRMKALEEKKTKYGMLRNNIAWEAISDNMSTRTSVKCCKKWYDQLASSMVVEGIWNDTDDYLLISALVDVDACSAQEVDWDGLLDHRTGEICRRRWNQMIKYIGEYQQKSFPEQLELLATRYYRVIPDQSMETEESLPEDVEPSA